jgi:hypothetical protein
VPLLLPRLLLLPVPHLPVVLLLLLPVVPLLVPHLLLLLVPHLPVVLPPPPRLLLLPVLPPLLALKSVNH